MKSSYSTMSFLIGPFHHPTNRYQYLLWVFVEVNVENLYITGCKILPWVKCIPTNYISFFTCLSQNRPNSQIQECTCSISHNAPTECAHFCSKWSFVGYGTVAFWVLWIRSIARSHNAVHNQMWHHHKSLNRVKEIQSQFLKIIFWLQFVGSLCYVRNMIMHKLSRQTVYIPFQVLFWHLFITIGLLLRKKTLK